MDWTNIEANTISDYIDSTAFRVPDLYNSDFLDVSETISELSYLTHDYFRYYGKFPSKVAKYIIDTLLNKGSIDVKKDFIFDNYNGSGTSLVEAKIAGFESGGIDINPFGVLASNVKTYNYNIQRLQARFSQLLTAIKTAVPDAGLFQAVLEPSLDSGIAGLYSQIYVDFPDVEKWFDVDAIRELVAIKYYLLQMPYDKYREFFSLGFFAIIRRVSKAHDAEVRPHVNLKKKKRSAVAAYEKKITEMISTMQEWNLTVSNAVNARTFICNNSDKDNVVRIIRKLKQDYKKELGLVISHPPYLNCFDYIPVYRLKFLWAFGFDEIYGKMSYQQIKQEEIRSYPAKKDALVNRYFKHNMDAYKILYDELRPNGYCCVVIGDCTINKQLFSVHKMFIKVMENIGYTVEKVTYRSTAYGLGRYAYRHKADYNDREDGKKDAIIFFKK